MKRQLVIAVCSCSAHFYDHESSIDRMNSHINGDNYDTHKWVIIPDIIYTQEVGFARSVED